MTPTDLGIAGYCDAYELTRGGFATIYRARQVTFEREVAIKLLTGAMDETSVRRFRRECAAIGALSGHPNIVTVYDAGTTDDNRLYIVMELVHGGSLADQLDRQGVLDLQDVLDFGVRIAGAVESAHRAGILHRDLKPENILLSKLGEPKVADFGLAQFPGTDLSTSYGLTGTIVHAAPEVLAGDDPSIASDIYSLASTLFTLLSGRSPFGPQRDASLVSILTQITNEPPPDLRSHGVPDELCQVLEQGLAKTPAKRQRDMAQLGRQLQAVQVALGHSITRIPIEASEAANVPPVSVRGTPTPRARKAGRHRARLIVAGALGAGAVLALVLPRIGQDDAPLRVLYQDNFDAGQNWYEHDDEGARLAYDQGKYRVVVKRQHEVVLSDTSFRGGVYGEPLTMLDDVSVRVRAQPTGAAIFGLFCRSGPNGDYYQALIRTDGSALIVKSDATRIETLASGRLAAVGAGQEVALRLDCTGDSTSRIALFVDDRRVAEATDRDGIRQGSVGMVVSTEAPPADVLFEDFVLLGRRQA
jgi:hypothetical protein